tara:strand:- start:576 stop:1355 length:780 start_codon:yes stop_codon:yes gene_type:complete
MSETFFLGKAIGMLKFYDSFSAISYPATIINIIPAFIKQIKTRKAHGYNAISIISKGIINKSISCKKMNFIKFYENSVPKLIKNLFIVLISYEFRVVKDTIQNFKLGQHLKLTKFVAGQNVRISGLSIGKGFTGNQKRHNFTRGPLTHGSKNYRLPGSIGAGSTPGRVYPGKKMPGRMSYNKITQRTVIKFSRMKFDFDNVSNMDKKTSSLLYKESYLHSIFKAKAQKFFLPVYRDIICLKRVVPGFILIKNAVLKIYF